MLTGTTPARESALDVLALTREGRHAEAALSTVLNHEQLSARDRALVTEIVYGVLRWRDRLDAVMNRSATCGSLQISSHIRDILRIAFYQLIFLDRIPHSAAVNQAVSQVKSTANPRFAGLVNAVLRSFLRDTSVKDPRPSDRPHDLATYYSHPEWLVTQWLSEYGPDITRRILSANNGPAPLDIRINRLTGDSDQLMKLLHGYVSHIGAVKGSPDVLRITGVHGPIETLPGFAEGLFTVQSLASQMIGVFLEAQPGERILDACAAPGGKTAHLAALTNGKARITAVEHNQERVRAMIANLRRLRVEAEVVQADATDEAALPASARFDRILVDAPCSGLGVLRHNPETRYRTKEHEPPLYAEKQKKLLDTACKLLVPRGTLVYSVCSVTPQETYGVMQAFLNTHKNFRISAPKEPNLFRSEYQPQPGVLKTFPSVAQDEVDGFFAVRFSRL